MKGFIVHTTHTIIDNKTQIQLFGRLENNQSFVALCSFNPYFFIEQSNLEKAKPLLTKYKTEKTNFTTFDNKKVVKIIGNTQAEINKLASALHKKNINTYESDIKPAIRFLIDNDLLNSIEISSSENYETAEKIDRVYQNPKIKKSDFKANPKIISIDIEADHDTGELYCIGLYSKNYQKNFILSKKEVKNSTVCENEQELLEKFKQEIIEQDPDIITGWHVIDFDLAYLKQKFTKNKLQFDIGRTNQNPRIKIESGFFRSSTAEVPGRQVLDGLNLIRDPFIKEAPLIKNKKFNSFTLDDVSKEILGEGKLLKGKSRYNEIQELFEKNKEKLVEYNIKDCQLAYDILEKTKTIDLAIERASLTGISLNKITASIVSFDSLYIREARKKNLVSPTTVYGRKNERIKGGYVMESSPGLYHNLLVLDFKSLYPSIIKTFNIDPASHLEKPTKKEKIIISPNKTYFINQDGILPKIIEKLHQAREKAKKEKRELSSYAIKTIMNSFFGVLASPNCRYFSLDMANAITHFGQHIIKLTVKKIEEMGYKVIYSDTDSVFVKIETSKEKAKKLGKEIEEKINEFHSQHIKKEYQRKSYLELEFEKLYLAFMMPPIRDSKIASKKRYAGLIEEEGKEKIEVTGLEAIRGDWTEAAQEFQKELLNKVFHHEEFTKFIKTYVKKIKEGKLDAKLIYKKTLTKDLDKYTKTTPPHVKAARQLDSLDSNIIHYYITTKGPEPIQKLRHKIDYEHYIKKQIAPIANTILFFFDKNFEEIIQNSKQTTLF